MRDLPLCHRFPLGRSGLLRLFGPFLFAAVFAGNVKADVAGCSHAADPQQRGRLLELYTSQGCSSCPPADRWLRLIALQPSTNPVVPLSLHVSYWDYIGWKDPYADEAFTARQRWLATLNRNRTVYTPGVFLDGVEWPDWSSAASQRARLRDGAGSLAAANLSIHVDYPAEGMKAAAGPAVRIEASLRESDWSRTGRRIALQVALTESGLGNDVTAGENRGVVLRHDHVVRRWLPRVDIVGGEIATTGLVIDEQDWRSDRFAVSAFVQDLDSGAVLQATRLNLASCRRSSSS